MVKVPSKLSYSFCDSETDSWAVVSQKKHSWPCCRVTTIAALCCLAEAAGLWFSDQTPVIMDFCLWKLALHLCVWFPVPWVCVSALALCSWDKALIPQLPGSSFVGVTVGRASWERVCFASGFTIRASKQFSAIRGNWSHSVKFHLVNTFWLKESNSIKVFVKGQIYLPLFLRIMPKPFVLNNKKALNWRKAFNRIELEQGS